MKVVRVTADLTALQFSAQQAAADEVARRELGTPMLLSWYDAIRDIESPNGVSECSEAAPDVGVRRYSASRGGSLEVELCELSEMGDKEETGGPPRVSVFCYLDLAE